MTATVHPDDQQHESQLTQGRRKVSMFQHGQT